MKFEIGQIIICNRATPLPGNSVGPRLNTGASYPVKAIIQCPNCGSDHLDVGLARDFESIRCYDCKEELPGTKIAYCHPSRFSA
jgi:hypothetical protein